MDLVSSIALTALFARVIPAGSKPLRCRTGNIGLGIVTHHQHSGRIRSPHQRESVLKNSGIWLGNPDLVGNNQGCEPLAPAQLAKSASLGNAEAVGDDAHLHLLLQQL